MYRVVEQAPKDRIVVGTKQVMRGILGGQIEYVVVAKDADRPLLDRIINECNDKKIPCHEVAEKSQLGLRVGVKIGTAVIGILKKQ